MQKVLAILLLLAPALASAQSFPAFTQTDTYSNAGWGVNTTRGWSFTVSAPIVVEQLGFWDSSQDGLATSHGVGLWRGDGTLLTSATVPAGTGGTLVGTFRWVPVAEVELSPGTTYVVGAYWSTGDPDMILGAGENVVFDSRVSRVEGRGINAPGLAYPPLVVAVEMTANFKARPSLTDVDDREAARFALRGVTPNPAQHELRVAFSLRDSKAATLTLLDVSGRQLAARRVDGMGVGWHTVTLGGQSDLSAGLYFIHLTQNGRTLTTRAIVVR